MIRCASCNRQITNNNTSDNHQAPLPAKALGFGNWICKDCGKDLDQHGLFPEERSLLSKDEYRQMYGN